MSAELVHDLPVAEPNVRRLTLRPHYVPLAAILVLAACLDFWNLTQNGYANTYYAGADTVYWQVAGAVKSATLAGHPSGDLAAPAA